MQEQDKLVRTLLKDKVVTKSAMSRSSIEAAKEFNDDKPREEVSAREIILTLSYNEIRKQLKANGVNANGKLEVLVERLLAVWEKRKPPSGGPTRTELTKRKRKPYKLYGSPMHGFPNEAEELTNAFVKLRF